MAGGSEDSKSFVEENAAVAHDNASFLTEIFERISRHGGSLLINRLCAIKTNNGMRELGLF